MTQTFSRTRGALVVIVGPLLALLVGSATVDARRASKSKRAQAKAAFQAGELAYNVGEFLKARAHYRRAYALLPLPAFLFNIGQCERMVGNYRRALFFYRGYLRRGHNTANRKLVVQLIQSTQQLMARRLKARAARTAGALARLRAAERRALERLRRLSSSILRTRRGVVPPAVPPSRPRTVPFYRRWWFWTAIAAGVLTATATGLGVGLSRRGAPLPAPGTLGRIDLR